MLGLIDAPLAICAVSPSMTIPQGPAPDDLVAALLDEAGRLSGQEKKLADYVLSDVTGASHASITDIAAAAGVSPPTVTRFCRHLGCSGFSDFKVKLARSSWAGVRYLRAQSNGATQAETLQDLASDLFSGAQTALADIQRRLDLALISRLGKQLVEAQMIYTVGLGAVSQMVAQELENRLMRLGLRVAHCRDHRSAVAVAAGASEGTVVFLASVSGQSQEAEHILRLFAARGVQTIALTRSDTPVARAAASVIAIDTPDPKGGAERAPRVRYAMLAMTDLLSVAVAAVDRPASARHLSAVADQIALWDGPSAHPLLED